MPVRRLTEVVDEPLHLEVRTPQPDQTEQVKEESDLAPQG